MSDFPIASALTQNHELIGITVCHDEESVRGIQAFYGDHRTNEEQPLYPIGLVVNEQTWDDT